MLVSWPDDQLWAMAMKGEFWENNPFASKPILLTYVYALSLCQTCKFRQKKLLIN